MGQTLVMANQPVDWTNAAQYARYLRSDRRTWAWLWLKRNPAFQGDLKGREHSPCCQRDGSICLVENLCRHF
ncbi:transcriptional regulator domain-containing protein [Asticcacaulis sp.]|uniref:transcriptional regulator domain-containing protein n=1 Tax=Asticcacaulis sp. TaxID=1872648 RepID=UPI0039E54C03